MTNIRAKDYVLVDKCLYFAVVSDDIESERALAWLRYVKDKDGMHKLTTAEANAYVKNHVPEFLFHSAIADTELHGIPLERIASVLKPQNAVEKLLSMNVADAIQQDAIDIIKLLIDKEIERRRIGITGSILLEAHGESSDIDMIIYGRDAFFQARTVIRKGLNEGILDWLDSEDWRDAYNRRMCSLDFESYCWHEKRKLNKCISGSSKVDITMLPDPEEQISWTGSYKKRHHETITALVEDDRYAYDFPARYPVVHNSIDEVLVFTGTYIGQAIKGETIEASGMVEQDESGNRRLVVGTSREATGEYIIVLD